VSPRLQTLIVSLLICLALVGLFAGFIWFRRNGELIAALSAAGTVAAGVFAALAAAGSMRAAAESSAAARRSQEAAARTAQPRIRPSTSRKDGTTLGTVQCDGSRGAVDVTVAWILHNGETIVDRTTRLEPLRPDHPPAGTALTVDLKLPETAKASDEINMVWIEYWDDRRVGHWRDTWRARTEPQSEGIFVQTDSQLVD
jgi:hypothetical protein